MVYYNNAIVTINGSGILAQNASLSSSNSLTSAKVLGQKNPPNKTTSGPINNKIGISYVSNLAGDPILNFIDSYRNDTTYFNKFVVSVAGLSGSFYIENYTSKLSANGNLESNASFISYNQLSGDVSDPAPTLPNNIATNRDPNNSWTTSFYKNGDQSAQNIFEFSYSIDFAAAPNYILGKMEPYSVSFFGAKEELSLNLDTYNNINISGQLTDSYLSDIDRIELRPLSQVFDNPLYDVFVKKIPITGMWIGDIKTEARLDDIIRVSLTASKEY